MRAFKRFALDIPKGSIIYGDRTYNNYDFEDFLSDHAEIHLIAQRRKNSKRPLLAELRKKVDPNGHLWQTVLETTGQAQKTPQI